MERHGHARCRNRRRAEAGQYKSAKANTLLEVIVVLNRAGAQEERPWIPIYPVVHTEGMGELLWNQDCSGFGIRCILQRIFVVRKVINNEIVIDIHLRSL